MFQARIMPIWLEVKAPVTRLGRPMCAAEASVGTSGELGGTGFWRTARLNLGGSRRTMTGCVSSSKVGRGQPHDRGTMTCCLIVKVRYQALISGPLPQWLLRCQP